MTDLIERHRFGLEDLCRSYHVKTLELFGSATDGTFDPARSDLDFLVEFLPEAAGRVFHGYFDLKEALQRLLGRPVDLVMLGAVRNRYFLEAVARQRKVLFRQSGEGEPEPRLPVEPVPQLLNKTAAFGGEGST
jgi:uncharacterized protein